MTELERYLNLVHDWDDWVCVLLLRRDFQGKAVQAETRFGPVCKLFCEDGVKELEARNAQGWDVYLTINSLKALSFSKRRENFLPLQRTIFLDVDKAAESEKLERLAGFLRENGLPGPSLITRTSADNYHLYWIFRDAVSFTKLQKIMIYLENEFGLDHTHDISRCPRLPCFLNWKRGGKAKVELVEQAGPLFASCARLDDSCLSRFLALVPQAQGQENQPRPDILSLCTGEKLSGEKAKELEDLYLSLLQATPTTDRSRVDWRFCCVCLARQIAEPAEIASFLAEIRKNKKGRWAESYAARTVQKAAVWLAQQKQKRGGKNAGYRQEKKEAAKPAQFQPAL